jgi:putative ABC transport system permease protein
VRSQIRADFGGLEQIKEACRDERGTGVVDRAGQDLRYAWRMFLKHPGFTIAVVGTLGLGIGGATTMFGVVDGVLLKPLPYRHADRILQIGRVFGGRPRQRNICRRLRSSGLARALAFADCRRAD